MKKLIGSYEHMRGGLLITIFTVGLSDLIHFIEEPSVSITLGLSVEAGQISQRRLFKSLGLRMKAWLPTF